MVRHLHLPSPSKGEGSLAAVFSKGNLVTTAELWPSPSEWRGWRQPGEAAKSYTALDHSYMRQEVVMGAPSIERLEHWTLVSTDIEKTKHFYVDVLGAKLPERQGGPTSVNLAGTIIDFFPANPSAAPQPGS